MDAGRVASTLPSDLPLLLCPREHIASAFLTYWFRPFALPLRKSLVLEENEAGLQFSLCYSNVYIVFLQWDPSLATIMKMPFLHFY